MPQGSVLGPLEFISYTEDVSLVFERHNIKYHLFAIDKQAYASASLQDLRERLLDLGNSVLAGLPKSAIIPLQHVQNAAAWLIRDLRMSEHVTPALRHLHCVPIDMRVQYKLCTMHSIHIRQCPTWFFPSLLTRRGKD